MKCDVCVSPLTIVSLIVVSGLVSFSACGIKQEEFLGQGEL